MLVGLRRWDACKLSCRAERICLYDGLRGLEEDDGYIHIYTPRYIDKIRLDGMNEDGLALMILRAGFCRLVGRA